MKMPLLKAFEVIFMLSVRKKGMSSLEIGRTYKLNKDTAWLLKKKVQYGMFSSGKNLLKNEVHVDEFAVGGKEKNKQGRSSTSKKVKVALACEVITHKGKKTIGNAYAQVIENYSTRQLRPIFQQKICSTAKVKTDKWRSYLPLTKTHNIEQTKSKPGENFKELNNLTMLIKGWIRGIHHHIGKDNMQNYLNEFFFRFNRKAFAGVGFHRLIDNLMISKPMFIQLRETNG